MKEPSISQLLLCKLHSLAEVIGIFGGRSRSPFLTSKRNGLVGQITLPCPATGKSFCVGIQGTRLQAVDSRCLINLYSGYVTDRRTGYPVVYPCGIPLLRRGAIEGEICYSIHFLHFRVSWLLHDDDDKSTTPVPVIYVSGQVADSFFLCS